MSMFAGKIGLIMGVANEWSIGWAISRSLHAEGAELAFTHLPSPANERRVRELVKDRSPKVVVPCDVQKDADIARLEQCLSRFKSVEGVNVEQEGGD